MTNKNAGGAWRAPAAYLYTLDLDAGELAWEYLRRHPQYRSDWTSAAARAAPERWGLRFRRGSSTRCTPGSAAVDRRA